MDATHDTSPDDTRAGPGRATPGDRWRQGAVIVALIGTVVVNALANILPIGGRTTGDISDGFPILFVPAGYVFSIWGLIYLWLAVYAVYQALPAQAANPRLRAIGWLFVLSCVFNSAWIFVWHNLLIPASMLVMIGILVTLSLIYLRLRGRGEPSPAERWAAWAPFSLYLGWITVATVANASVTLYTLGWRGGGVVGEILAALLLLVATGLGAIMLIRYRDTIYALVLVWAFAGIAVKHWEVILVSGGAVATAGLMALGVLRALARPRDPGHAGP